LLISSGRFSFQFYRVPVIGAPAFFLSDPFSRRQISRLRASNRLPTQEAASAALPFCVFGMSLVKNRLSFLYHLFPMSMKKSFLPSEKGQLSFYVCFKFQRRVTLFFLRSSFFFFYFRMRDQLSRHRLIFASVGVSPFPLLLSLKASNIFGRFPRWALIIRHLLHVGRSLCVGSVLVCSTDIACFCFQPHIRFSLFALFFEVVPSDPFMHRGRNHKSTAAVLLSSRWVYVCSLPFFLCFFADHFPLFFVAHLLSLAASSPC